MYGHKDFSDDLVVKNPPAIQYTQVNPWAGKIPLEKKMATHFNILAWEIPWTEEPGAGGGAKVHGVAKESDITEKLNNNNNSHVIIYFM